MHAPETERWAFYVDGYQIQLYIKVYNQAYLALLTFTVTFKTIYV